MKWNIQLLLLIILCSSENLYSQDGVSQKIVGSWLYKGTGEYKNQVIECPDVLEFNANGEYIIFNDCYGDDMKNPSVEHGQWSYDSKENKITLKDRKISTSYAFHNSNSSLILYINEFNDKSLKICFNQGKCTFELYERFYLPSH